MESFTLKNVSFTYPEQEKKALEDISLTVEKGEFIVLCGASGCGKSTLLRQLKSVLAPHGVLEGEILFEGTLLNEVDDRTQSQKIGYVLQSPENQIVTDKVWHELAFGLESLGFDTPTIRRRVAEMASFFGIQTWFYKNVSELSGGQKQLVSLASIMAMQPSVLILDEPTSQLDPIAASDFLATIGKINRELGVTVILTEHRLEEAFPMATRVVVMDSGRILCSGTPENVGMSLRNSGHGMFLAMPTAMRVWAEFDTDLKCPVTVRDGRTFLHEFVSSISLEEVPPERVYDSGDTVLKGEGIWFKYDKDASDVVKGLDIELCRGEFLALLGGNGTGKTTSLKVLAGIKKPYRGDITVKGTIGVLPQNPQTLFVKNTVREDLFEILKGKKLKKEELEKKVAYVVGLCQLRELIDRHPYDISGGEQQRVALAKVLLMEPDILLMDEPTKGFDAEFKQTFAYIVKDLLRRGISVLMVSHDIEFCAKYAHRCALFFDGNIVASGTPRKFFSGNNFYTTSANRMARGIIDNAVTADDIVSACGGIPEKAKEPEGEVALLPKPRESSPTFKPAPLPVWRKVLACVFGLIAAAVFLYAAGIADLSTLVGAEGVTESGRGQLIMYGVLIVSLFGMVFTIGRRSAPPVILETPREKRILTKRTIFAAVLIVLCIPVTLFVGVAYLGGRQYNIVALLVLAECMLPFFLVFEGRKPKARELVVIAVLCSIGVAGRAAFFMLPQFKPVLAVVIISGVAFGGETGFLVGAVTMLASNVMFSQGPWTPWQMFAMGIIGFLAGILFKKGFMRRSRGALAVFGAFSAIVIYGGIMNCSSALMWGGGALNFKVVLAYCVTGFPMDCVHAIATVFFIWVAAEPMLKKLDRIKVKYGLVE